MTYGSTCSIICIMGRDGYMSTQTESQAKQLYESIRNSYKSNGKRKTIHKWENLTDRERKYYCGWAQALEQRSEENEQSF